MLSLCALWPQLKNQSLKTLFLVFQPMSRTGLLIRFDRECLSIIFFSQLLTNHVHGLQLMKQISGEIEVETASCQNFHSVAHDIHTEIKKIGHSDLKWQRKLFLKELASPFRCLTARLALVLVKGRKQSHVVLPKIFDDCLDGDFPPSPHRPKSCKKGQTGRICGQIYIFVVIFVSDVVRLLEHLWSRASND